VFNYESGLESGAIGVAGAEFVKSWESAITVKTELGLGDRQVLIVYDPADWDEAFEAVCRLNPDARVEQTSEGEIVIMPPAGGESGFQSGEAFWQLNTWAKHEGSGRAFDSSAGFQLPNGAKRSPDASWVRTDKILAISKQARKTLLPFAPDFAIEIMSPTDRFREQDEKCREYIANGTVEAWLVEPSTKSVWIYTIDSNPKELNGVDSVASVSLPGFTLDLKPIWQGLDF
jgi:Uma2 family endonuclease